MFPQTPDLKVFSNVKEPLDLALRQGDLPEVDVVQDVSNLSLGDVFWHEQNWVSCSGWGERGKQTPEVWGHCAEDHLQKEKIVR